MMEAPLDCLIIGGGPAGLTAAIYLGRFRRGVLVVDAGLSRARWIPSTRNYPGFPDGVAGTDLLHNMRVQAARFGARIETASISGIEPVDGGFALRSDSGSWAATTLLIATGVADNLPAVPGVTEQMIVSGRLRVCPVCDAFEVVDRRIAVWGHAGKAAKEALFLRAYTANITVLVAAETTMREQDRGSLAEAGIAVFEDAVLGVEQQENQIVLKHENGQTRRFDYLYLAMGARPRSELAKAVGAELNEAGCLLVDAHQRTSVPNMYSAGDVVNELDQISVAVGHAAIAATAIHNRIAELRRERS